jgi:dynein heavy chain
VKVKCDSDVPKTKKTAAIITKVEDIEIVDNQNGTYLVTYTAPKADGYKVHIDFEGTFKGEAGPIRGSPFQATFVEGANAKNNALDGPMMAALVKDKISSTKDFCNKTLRGLKKTVPSGDLDELIKTKEHLRNVDQRKIQVDYDLDTTRTMLEYVKQSTGGKSADRDLKNLAAVTASWGDVEKQAPVTMQEIVPETKSQATSQQERIADYTKKLDREAYNFKSEVFWFFDTGAEKARINMQSERERLAIERADMEHLANLASLFEFPEAIDKAREFIDGMDNGIVWMEDMWNIIESALEFFSESKEALWTEVKAEDLEDESKRFMKLTKGTNKNIRWCKAYQGMDKANKDFLNTTPLISALHHESVRLRHWAMLQKAAGKDFTPPPEDPNCTLGDLLALNLHEFSADVEEICDQAIKEAKMEAGLVTLKEYWDKVEWFSDMYKVHGQADVPLVKLLEDDFEALEADQLIVQGMLANRYVAQFEDEVNLWQKELAMVSEIILVNTEVQRTWSYLEPLFIHSAEVQKELPETAAKFKLIDVEVKKCLNGMHKDLNVKKACNRDNLLEDFEQIQTDLEVCKKSLADFLDGRRRQFPRYYFTSEADLLDILSNGSNPQRILIHVPKIYLATKTFTIDEKPAGADDEWRPTVQTFIANVGVEEITFEPKVHLVGKVEIYMQTLLDAMKTTLYEHCKRCLKRYDDLPRMEWLMHGGKIPTDSAQICLLVSAINYSGQVEKAFADMGMGDKDAMKAYNAKQINEIKELINVTTTALSSGQRKRVMCMITLDAHNRDIVAKMVRSEVPVASHFQWQSQLKMWWRPPKFGFVNRDPHLRGSGGERAEITNLNCCLPYDYEYLGNGPRLVVTPLTDRIYVTATQALNLKMGCAPAGPAGTGKTESTKDLASALGKVCYVFNCSPEMDYQSMGNIYKGLASSGSWGCFDEFNRLIPEVLSVCSVQFKAVCDGVAAETPTCTVEGDEVSLDPTCGAFITMNPGYLGRSELPEGLKALFRPMTVMVPDLVLICENMMMAEGYEEASSLASKFYGLYSLLKQLLSKQLHYDWGLRAVKSVLVVAGGFKRAEPNAPEQALLMRALRDFNIPKIPACDTPIFFGLMGDLFPGINPPRMVNEELEAKISEAAIALNYQVDEEWHLKVVQLEELLAIRHCVFVMGSAGAYKSSTWRTLAHARLLLDKATQETKIVDVNPKSISTKELYGYITMATREWRDGLLSKIMRDLGNIPDEKPKWILLDGDLDANWIESMNSVMDDNRMLTLASNERIPLKPHMRMIFEIRDLKHATPATVSRAGILYISNDSGFQYRCLIDAWLQKRPERDEIKAVLRKSFDTYIEPTVVYIAKFIRPILHVEDITFVSSLLFMLEAIIPLIEKMRLKHEQEAKERAAEAEDAEDEDGAPAPEEPTEEQLPEDKIYATVFIFCCVWAFGCGLTIADDGTDYRKMFSDWWRSEWKEIKFPSRETVFDYYLDPETWKLEPWSKSPYFYTVDFNSAKTPMSAITVPTTETAATSFWMDKLVDDMHPVMLAGPAGTGKTQLILGMLHKQDPTVRGSCVVNFNFYTGADVLKTTMEVPLEKKTGMNFGPPGQTKLIYFVDDLNLPEVDNYNTQSAIALLRQHMEYGHIYDIGKLMAKYIANTMVVSCLNPTAGSFVVNPRLQRWYTTFAIGMPGPGSLLTIYQTFLDGHLIHAEFPESIQEMSSNLIKAALSLHTQVSQGFRKTAANFHYEFNVRHLSNVFQGMLVARPANFGTPEKFVHLWLHESERVYGDRLVSGADLSKFLTMAEGASKKNFPQFNVAKFFAKENAEPLIFCHFADNIQDKIYDQVTSIDHLSKTLVNALEEYNETNAAMDLVLFLDAMKHVCRIVRIMQNEGGHALLVGVGGSGKQSLSRLAAFICVFTVKQIVISSTYGINDLKEDLKWMYNKAGLRDEGIMFLLTDSQITNERFLIYLNDLLASGDIPDLFAGEELDAVINGCMPKLKAAGITMDKNHAWTYFISEIRKNLHCALCFSPVGDDFRLRAAKFPAVVNCTVIDWFQPWPVDALYAVGKKFLADVDVGEEPVRLGIQAFMPFSFAEVGKASEEFLRIERRFVYSTPKSFLELLKLYSLLLEQKREESGAAIERLANGLLKLKETSEAVSRIEEDLKVALVAADEKKVVSEGIAEVVAKEKAIVEKATAEAEVEAGKSKKISDEVGVKQRDTEADLAKAIPAVEQAMAALNTLNKKDLSECKTMLKPPGGVDDVFAATMILLASIHPNVVVDKKGRVKDSSWDAAKKQLLGNIPDYLDHLLHYKEKVDTQQVPDINFKQVRPLLEIETFDVEIIKGKNSAAGGLCAWVVNIVIYRDIVVTVEPKRIALEAANKQLAEANAKLKEVTELVAELQAKLSKLVKELNAANAEKKEAMDSVDRGNRKLDLAQRLTNALGAEAIRWADNVVQMEAAKNLLTGDVLIASAFISYVGPFTKPFRTRLMETTFVPFLKTAAGGESIPMSEDVDPVSILSTPAMIATWQGQTLPADQVSTENGCILTGSARWPLIIDPQLQGISWIREKESDPSRDLQIVRLGQKDLTRRLERAIEAGTSVLIENMGERVDAVLTPVIQRATTKRGHKYYVKLGDTEVEFHKDFKLFLHTKLGNPHFPPEIQAECTLINFTVTILGLEDQLLVQTVKKERPELASEQARLVEEDRGFKIKVKELEDQILYKLATAEGDITEDVELIEGLEDAKAISNDIAEKMEIAAEIQAKIQVTSEKYRSVAARAALLFFLMNDLVKMHTYYIYSLAAFMKVFFQGIDRATDKPDEDEEEEEAAEEGGEGEGEAAAEEEEEVEEMSDEELAERCLKLNSFVTETVFNYIRRGLFEKDKLTVATQLTLKILTKSGALDPEEVNFLVDAGVSLDAGNMGPLAEWMPEPLWPKVKFLEGMKIFKGLGDIMQTDTDEWQKWFDNEKAELEAPPGDLKDLSEFHRLLLLRALRPDRLPSGLAHWVGNEIGQNYVVQTPYDMAATYAETDPQTPVFFVLFAGVDPTPWVEGIGKEEGFTIANGKFVNISMGQGQEKPAEAVTERFAKEGGWAMLQNCHLMQTWVPNLERLFERVCEDAHEDFRLFLSAEPPPFAAWKNMPESLMQSCIKVANEAPADIKSNLNRAWASFSQERIDVNTKPDAFKGCLFGLVWFHAVMLGRKKFGQMGWSRKYSFNMGDLRICSNVLTDYLDNNPITPYEDLRYIFGEIMYGGHITDAWDRRTCNTYLAVIETEGLFNKSVLGESGGKQFLSPTSSELDYQGYFDYIETAMVPESPTLFGMHTNAEIGYLTTVTNSLFATILSMSGSGSGDGGGGEDKVVKNMTLIMEECPENSEMVGINILLKEVEATEEGLKEGPFNQVVLQECTRMNVLLDEIRRSLVELDKGLKGQLNMSPAMEDLAECMQSAMVPGRNPFHGCNWEGKAWFSMKGLLPWFIDLKKRCSQLALWTEELNRPFCLWLPGLFNPTAYITAAMQCTAREDGLALDQMTTETHCSMMHEASEVDHHPHGGGFVEGLFIEGARWPDKDEVDEVVEVGGEPCGGYIVESRSKELLPLLPIVYVKAVQTQPQWEPSSVGYLRHDPHIYEAPIYITQFRGPTYVELATLATVDPPSKWTLAAVAVVFQSED